MFVASERTGVCKWLLQSSCLKLSTESCTRPSNYCHWSTEDKLSRMPFRTGRKSRSKCRWSFARVHYWLLVKGCLWCHGWNLRRSWEQWMWTWGQQHRFPNAPSTASLGSCESEQSPQRTTIWGRHLRRKAMLLSRTSLAVDFHVAGPYSARKRWGTRTSLYRSNSCSKRNTHQIPLYLSPHVL